MRGSIYLSVISIAISLIGLAISLQKIFGS